MVALLTVIACNVKGLAARTSCSETTYNTCADLHKAATFFGLEKLQEIAIRAVSDANIVAKSKIGAEKDLDDSKLTFPVEYLTALDSIRSDDSKSGMALRQAYYDLIDLTNFWVLRLPAFKENLRLLPMVAVDILTMGISI